jgi:hypothetical protein
MKTGSMSFGWNFQNHIFSMKFKGDVFISKKLLFHLNNIEPENTDIITKFCSEYDVEEELAKEYFIEVKSFSTCVQIQQTD